MYFPPIFEQKYVFNDYFRLGKRLKEPCRVRIEQVRAPQGLSPLQMLEIEKKLSPFRKLKDVKYTKYNTLIKKRYDLRIKAPFTGPLKELM